jgi:hypothetical protein
VKPYPVLRYVRHHGSGFLQGTLVHSLSWRRIAAPLFAALVAACGSSLQTVPPPPVSTPPPTIAVPTPQEHVTVPASIDATGGSDVSVAIQAFVDSVPDNREIRFVAGGIYNLATSGIAIAGRHDLIFDGQGSTLRIAGCNVVNSAFLIGQADVSSDIVIRNFNIVGDNEAAGTPDAYNGNCEFQMGVAIYGASNIDIVNVNIRNVHGDCLYLGARGSADSWTTGVTYSDSQCELAGRMGVAITGGKHVQLERLVVDRIGISAFDIEPNEDYEGASDVWIVNNQVGDFGVSKNWHPSWFVEANGAEKARVDSITVSGNSLSAQPLFVKAQEPNRTNIVIENNRSSVLADGPVMFFEYTDGVVVVGNDQPLQSGSLASFKDCTEVSFES